MKEVRGLLVIHLPSNIFHHTSSDCTGGRIAMQFDTASQNYYAVHKARKMTYKLQKFGLFITYFDEAK